MLSSNPSMDTTYGPINLDFCRGTISNDVHICLSNEAMSHQQCSPLDGSFINHTTAESDKDEIQLPARNVTAAGHNNEYSYIFMFVLTSNI